MNRRGADLGTRRDHPCTAPLATMIELPAVRVSGGGGGRGRAMRPRRGCLAQRYELQGRVHGPAHQRPERALVLAVVGHRREHVFVRLRLGSDGRQRRVRDLEGAISESRGAKPNGPERAASDLAQAAKAGRARPPNAAVQREERDDYAPCPRGGRHTDPVRAGCLEEAGWTDDKPGRRTAGAPGAAEPPEPCGLTELRGGGQDYRPQGTGILATPPGDLDAACPG